MAELEAQLEEGNHEVLHGILTETGGDEEPVPREEVVIVDSFFVMRLR